MQSIQLPDDQFQRLSATAKAAGYQDVDAFIASITDEPIEDPRGTLTEAQLRASVECMERGDADIAAGRGIDMKDALLGVAEKYGLNITQ